MATIHPPTPRGTPAQRRRRGNAARERPKSGQRAGKERARAGSTIGNGLVQSPRVAALRGLIVLKIRPSCPRGFTQDIPALNENPTHTATRSTWGGIWPFFRSLRKPMVLSHNRVGVLREFRKHRVFLRAETGRFSAVSKRVRYELDSRTGSRGAGISGVVSGCSLSGEAGRSFGLLFICGGIATCGRCAARARVPGNQRRHRRCELASRAEPPNRRLRPATPASANSQRRGGFCVFRAF